MKYREKNLDLVDYTEAINEARVVNLCSIMRERVTELSFMESFDPPQFADRKGRGTKDALTPIIILGEVLQKSPRVMQNCI